MEDAPADAPHPLLGKAAPPITLEGTQGSYDLEKARAEGPVLAIFYRGDW
jgi:peroxiredoxin